MNLTPELENMIREIHAVVCGKNDRSGPNRRTQSRREALDAIVDRLLTLPRSKRRDWNFPGPLWEDTPMHAEDACPRVAALSVVVGRCGQLKPFKVPGIAVRDLVLETLKEHPRFVVTTLGEIGLRRGSVLGAVVERDGPFGGVEKPKPVKKLFFDDENPEDFEDEEEDEEPAPKKLVFPGEKDEDEDPELDEEPEPTLPPKRKVTFDWGVEETAPEPGSVEDQLAKKGLKPLKLNVKTTEQK